MGNLRFRQVHLDFDNPSEIKEVGNLFDPKEFADTLVKAGVNSITCFAKDTMGMLYYDTKFQSKHPGLKRNLLKEQIKACHSVGIRVPIYICVVWDEYIARRHHEWLERTPDGKTYGFPPTEGVSIPVRTLCLNSPYADYVEELTIEVLEVFGEDVDGLFYDCVWADPCSCSYCLKDMKKEGLDPKIEDNRRRFAEDLVIKFKKRITDTIRKYNKSCSIFYNAGHIRPSIRNSLDCYTHIEIEALQSGGWGYEFLPIMAKYVRNLGKEYLGMTSRFHKSWSDFGGYKNKGALEYECFTAIANGAKCSIGDQLHPSGVIDKASYELVGSVYNKIKEKEAWCDDVRSVSEIGVFNTEGVIDNDNSFGKLDPSIVGIYRMLTESHYQFDVIDNEIDFDRYKTIILPDIITLDEKLRDKLQIYIKNGGNVILSYKSGMNRLEKKFILDGIGIYFVKEAEYSPDYIVAKKVINEGLLNTEYVMYDKGFWVKPKKDTQVLASIWNPYFNKSYKNFNSFFQVPVEKDSGYPAVTKNRNIIYFTHPIFSMYSKHGLRAYKQLIINCLELLSPEKLIETNAPTTMHINLNYQQSQDRYVLHILHYIPERRCEVIDTIEDIIPLYNIELRVKLNRKPNEVYCAPSNKKLSFVYSNGYCNIVVPKVVGHEMIVFE